MSLRTVKVGTADVSVVVRIVDSTDGTPEEGVVAATAGLALWYRRELGTKQAISGLSDLGTLDAAHSDGGLLHIDDGYYRLDIPDAACVAGIDGVLVGGVATGMVVVGCYLQLVGYDARTELTTTQLGYLDAAISSRSTLAAGAAMTLADDAITSAKYDESTAFPVAAADTGATQIARTGDAMALTPAERTTLASALWDALTSGLTTVGSIGKWILDKLDAAISSRATPADVAVSLAVSSTEAEGVSSGQMALTLWGSFDQTVESDTTEDLEAADALIWAVKLHMKRDEDEQALVLVDVATGLRYLARQEYEGDAGDGSLTLSGAEGGWSIRCQLKKDIPGELAEWADKNLQAQVKAVFGERTVVVWEGIARASYQTIREV